MKAFTSKPLELPLEQEQLARTDLVFYGVDHSGPSYEARIFLDNPEADAKTAPEPEQGYVGSFTVFGHSGCFGEGDHCHPVRPTTDQYDRRPPHPLVPFTRYIRVDGALGAIKKKKTRVTV